MRYLAKILVTLAFLLSATSCTIYTEKRSEALSQAVFATSDSIALARFDLADQYSKQAERLAFPPKQRIKLSSVYTTDTPNKLIPSLKVLVEIEDKLKKEDELITSVVDAPSDPVLRLVVPEHLKHAQLLIENSEEWNELIRTKDFSTKLKEDYANLQTLSVNVNKELRLVQHILLQT